MGSFKWLHLSDLHFRMCEGFDMSLILERLETVLKEEAKNEKFRYIFLTGDLADCCDYAMVEPRIKKIFLESEILENDGKIFWVCGNHDIPRGRKHRNREIADIRDKSKEDITFESEFVDDESRELLLNAFNEYYIARANLFGMGFIDEYPHQVIHTEDAEIVLLNTCLTSCDDEDEHKLYLCEPRLINLFNEIEQGKPVFVLGHHSLNYLADSDRRKLISLFCEKNVSVYLCGHAHQLGVQPLYENTQEIVSGGFKTDGHAVISFIIGIFDEEQGEYSLIPYTYRHGSMKWGEDYDAIQGMEKDKKYCMPFKKIENTDEIAHVIVRAAKLFQSISNIETIDVRIYNQIGEKVLQKYIQTFLDKERIKNMNFQTMCEMAVQKGNKTINYPSLRMTDTFKDIWRYRENFIRILHETGKDKVTFPVLEEMFFDFNDFFEIVNRFDVTENSYVLLTDAIHDIYNDLKKLIVEFQWDVVIDYDGYSEEGGLRSCLQRQNVKDLNGDYQVLRESILRRGITSWIRIGERMQFYLDNRESQLSLGKLRNIFEEVSKKLYENTNSMIFFVFIKDIDVWDKEFMRIIWERFGDKSRFILVGAYDTSTVKAQLHDLFLDSYGHATSNCYEVFQTSIAQFMKKYSEHSENFLKKKEHEDMRFPSDRGLVKLDRNLYVNLGDFFEVLTADVGTDFKHRKEELEKFYLGGEAVWSLFYTKDILKLMEQEVEEDLVNRLKTALGAKQDQPRKAIFYLLHDAGFGGTTAAKGIAWRMHKEYPTLILQCYEYGKIKPLIQNLYDNHSRKGILVLADENRFSISELENLEREMGLVDRPFALLIVRRSGWGKNGSVLKNAKKLNSLTNDMVAGLRSRFETQSYLDEEALREKNNRFDEIFPKNSSMRCPFLIGLYYQDERFNGVSGYVERIIRDIDSKEELKLLLILAVVNYYGRIGVTKEIVKKYIALPNNSSYLERYPYAKDAFIETYDEALQVRIYREKHLLISKELIEQCSVKLYGSGSQENLKDAVEELIKKVLEINSEGITLYYKNFIERLFIYKNATDVDENGYTNVLDFSPLILALPSQSSKEEVLCTLAEGVKQVVDQISVEANQLYYKMAAHICGHMGRLYKASTVSLETMENNQKSVEWCQNAENIMKRGGFEDAYIYHMYGTSLSKQCKDQLDGWKNDIESCSVEEIVNLELIVKRAIDKFEQTIFAGEFVRGCISKLSLLMEYMQFLMKWKGIESSEKINELSEKERIYIKDIDDLISMLEEMELDLKDEERLLNLKSKYKAEIIFNNYGKAIEYYTNSISNTIKNKGEDAEELYVLRSGLAGAILGKYFQEGKNPYLDMRNEDVERILEALEKNIFSTVVISNRWERQRRCNDCHRWLKVAKQSVKSVYIGINVAEKWKELQREIEIKDPRPYYYLAVLHYLNALDGYSESLDIAKINHNEAYKIACNNSYFRVVKTDKIRDILLEGKGMNRIKSVIDLSEILEQDGERVIKLKGKFQTVADEKKTKIGKIRVTFPQELSKTMVHFKMGDKNVISINQTTHMLEFGVGFTFERLEAINSTVKDISRNEKGTK